MDDREIDELLARYYRWTRINTPMSGLGYPRCSSPANRIPHGIEVDMPAPLDDREAEIVGRMILALRRDEKRVIELRYSRLPGVMDYREIAKKMECGKNTAYSLKKTAFARLSGMLTLV